MAYQINKTDGTIVATVPDGQVDQNSTDLTLIGKNYSGFGESLNENFVKLLENFAGTSEPTKPIKGQLWFDTSDLKLKVYSGNEFLPVSSATIADIQPISLTVGDLWYNSTDKQLYFYDGTDPILLGPLYSVSQGLSGFKVVSLLDSLNQTRVVTYFYNNGILLGIFSKDAFTPKAIIPGFTGNIIPGFNVGNATVNINGVETPLKFNVTCSNSEKLGGDSASAFVRTNTSNAIDGQLQITRDEGIIVGSAGQANLYVNNGNVFLSNSASDKNLTINVRRGLTQENAIEIVAPERKINFYSNILDSRVEFGGSVTIAGDLTIQGSTTTVSTSTVSVEDKNIELATSDVTSDDYADGGGITLKGTQATAVMTGSTIVGNVLTVGTLTSGIIYPWMKITGTGVADDTYIEFNITGAGDGAGANGSTWQVSKTQTVASTTITGSIGDKNIVWTKNSDSWNSTEHLNLAPGKEFRIGGQMVINGNSLGSFITSIPGVTEFGTQTVINVGPSVQPGSPPVPNLRLENNKISTLLSNQDLEIEPNGSGNISLIGSPRIVGLADPVDPQDASTREYVDNRLETRPLVFSIDLTDGKPNSYISSIILTNLAPPQFYRNGTQARVLCSILSNNNSTIDINPAITVGTAIFNTPSGTAPAVTSVSAGQIAVPPSGITTTRVIKIFQVIAGNWAHISDTLLP